MYQLPPSVTLDSMLMYLRKSRTDDPALSVEDVLAKHELRGHRPRRRALSRGRQR